MSRHDPRVTLAQMKSHALEAGDFVRGRRREELVTDRGLRLALERVLEIVGEAAKRRPGSPWSCATSIRKFRGGKSSACATCSFMDTTW